MTRELDGPARSPVAGGCSAPVRLAGRVDHVDTATGEVRRAFGPDTPEPGVVHVRCLNRRASACAECSRAYQGDARQIVMSGLAGGKGTPGSVAGHPALFVTLTAPSFGAVHSRRSRGGKRDVGRVCRTRRGQCVHGRALGCHLRHGPDDPRLGEPVCADCYDYAGQVVWNATVSALWRRTRERLESAVAASVGLPVSGLRRVLRLTFVKVAEMQARGVVHFHAVIRADGRGEDPADLVAPPGWATGELFAACLLAVVAEVSVAVPDPGGVLRAAGPGLDFAGAGAGGGERSGDGAGLLVRWGAQVDVRHVRLSAHDDRDDGDGGTGAAVTPGGDAPGATGGRLVGARRTANYLAKYTTKSTHDGGVLDRPVRSLAHLARLGLREHPRRLVETCLRLGLHGDYATALDEAAGRKPGRRCGLARWAHAYGFGSHWVSKSLRYSTTFGELRRARREFARRSAAGGVPVDAFGRPDGDRRTVVLAEWAYAGRGRPPDTGGTGAVPGAPGTWRAGP